MMIILKSQQIRTDFLSCFKTGTMGAAQSAYVTGSKIPLEINQSSSSSTSGRITYGTVRALQNLGLIAGST